MSDHDQVQVAYPVTDWDDYARVFKSVTPSFQLNIYQEAALHLQGDVVDCGCGAAKIAPMLADDLGVISYTGIDYSSVMVEQAMKTIKQLARPDFLIRQSRIEEVTGISFASGVSVQSYYSWPEPLEILNAIFNLLIPGASFVLATPNQDLNPEAVVRELRKELITHPDFEAFLDYNLKLATNPQANFVDMDELVNQVRQVGFQVQECHQRHLLGGMNFLVLRKGA